MNERKHGGGTPQSTSRAVLPAYDRKESRKPTADPDPQLRMNDVVKADARGKAVVSYGNAECGKHGKEIGRGGRYVV